MNATTSVSLYSATRARVTELAQSLSPEDLATRVPACPDWTVHDVISHLAGVAADFSTGNLAGAPRPPWTAVQVEARRNLPIDAILDEWSVAGAALEAVILADASDHPLVCHPYVDSGTHEADLYGALSTGDRPPTDLCLTTLAWVFSDRTPDPDCPGTLTMHTPEATYTLVGAGPSHSEVHTTTYDLYRAIFGRRSPTQIATWTWTTPPTTWPTTLPRLPQTAYDLVD